MKFSLGIFLLGLLVCSAADDPQFKSKEVEVLFIDPVSAEKDPVKTYLKENRNNRMTTVTNKISSLFQKAKYGFATFGNAGDTNCMTNINKFEAANTMINAYESLTIPDDDKALNGSFQGTIMAVTNENINWTHNENVVKIVVIASEGAPKEAPKISQKPMKGDGKDQCAMDAPSVDILSSVLKDRKIAVVAVVPEAIKQIWESYITKFSFNSSVVLLENDVEKYATEVQAAVTKIAQAYKPETPTEAPNTTTATMTTAGAVRYSAALATAVLVGSQAF